jgi:hypothetical protein
MTSYANGAISGQGPWTNSSSTWGSGTGSPSVTVSATPLSYTGYSATTKSASFSTSGDTPGRDFNGAAITSGPVYIAFLVKFSTVTTSITVTNGQFLRLRDKSGSFSSCSRLGANTFVTDVDPSLNSFKLAISKDGAAGNTVSTPSLLIANTHLVVIKYVVNAGTTDDVVSLIVDPTSGGSEPAATVSTSAGSDQYTGTNQIQGLSIFQSFGAANTGQISSFRVATTWADLFPTCFTPSSPVMSGITPTTATATWTPSSSGPAPANYDYELSTTPTFTGTPSVSGVATPLNLTGLTPNTTYYIKVRSNCGGGNGSSSWSSAVTFKTLPTCPVPNAPTISMLTGTSAQVTITTTPVSGQTTPTTFDYELVLASASYTNTPTATAVTSPISLTALTVNTAYKIQVRSNCGGGDLSPSWSTASFSTPCNSYDISSMTFTEGFNNSSTSYACWSTAQVLGSSLGITAATTINSPTATRYEGDRVIRYNGYGVTSGNVSRLISPVFSTMGMTGVQMSFVATENYSSSYSYEDQLTAEYSIDGGTTWTTLGDVWRNNPALINNDTARWVLRSFTLPSNAVNQTNLKIALKFTSQYGMNFFVDDFKIGAPTAIADADANNCNALTTTNAWGNDVIPMNGKNWFRVSNGGNVVLEINPNNNNLGAMSMSFKENTAGSANVPTASGVAYLPRYFSIKPTTQPTTPVSVRLYYSNTELTDYNTASGLAAATKSTLNISKFSNTSGVEDCAPSGSGSGTGLVIAPASITAVDYGTGFYLQFNVSSFSEFAALSPSSVLAVEFTNISVVAKGTMNVINFSTATEKDIKEFAIERSVNNRTWEVIGTKAAVGGTKTTNYSFNDVNPTTLSYYRVRSIETNGKDQLSKIVAVKRNGGKLAVNMVSPVPTTEGVNVDFSTSKIGTLNVVITDIVGKVVKTERFTTIEGNNLMRLNLSNLSVGTYILSMNDGETVATQRIVKQ